MKGGVTVHESVPPTFTAMDRQSMNGTNTKKLLVLVLPKGVLHAIARVSASSAVSVVFFGVRSLNKNRHPIGMPVMIRTPEELKVKPEPICAL